MKLPQPLPPVWKDGTLRIRYPCAHCTDALVNIMEDTDESWKYVDVSSGRLVDTDEDLTVFEKGQDKCALPLPPGTYHMIVSVGKVIKGETVWSDQSEHTTFEVFKDR